MEFSGNRRSKRRLPIQLALQFKATVKNVGNVTGNGTVIDMSSSGIAFTTDQSFPVGTPIQLSIVWPVLLNAEAPIKLVVQGRVVRSDRRITAIRMTRHEFYTQKQ
jgi:hypothetical protein